MFRKSLLAGVAVAGLFASSAPALSDDRLVAMDVGGISPLYGKINPFYGKINPFYGSVDPFYGKINPFYGKINPFWGDISPFWGKINPFYGKINPFLGPLDPFWGKINPFTQPGSFYGTLGPYWQSAGPQWGDINAAWDALQASNASDYSGLQAQLNTFLANASTTWSAAVKKGAPGAPPPPPGTVYSFQSSFAAPLMAQYGIDPTNAASLANVSAGQRSAFFLDFYDSLMNYSGTDHIDWWMAAVHWSPMLAQIQGSANNASVGILDAYTTPQFADVSRLDFAGGYRNNVLDHGAAVASLIAAKQDGTGVMGVAPNATIQVLYNPFDGTGTADWSDVATGIAALFAKKATVINASLGVPGFVLTHEWSDILNSSSVSSTKRQLVLVKAAGNDGVMQTTDVAWAGAAPTNLILVGSVDPYNNISGFSNTPGEACILVAGTCSEQNKLKYRFIVAPGELLLVQDNHGGNTRVSGTSFAAPLVTGAISLLQDRWPWLQQNADETVQIILQSATDLGAPGVDPVYGWGELNIEASQSPLNWDTLQVYRGASSAGGDVKLDPSKPLGTAMTPASLKASVLTPGQLALWQNQGAYVVAFETIGDTYRDFQIPLSSLLTDNKIDIGKGNNPFESYLYQRMIDWANGTQSLTFNAQGVHIGKGAWALNMTSTESTPQELSQGAGPFHSEFVASNKSVGIALRLGEGNASHAFFGDGAFSLRSDFDPATGGVNPILGFASGGPYAQGRFALSDEIALSLAVSQKTDDHIYVDPTLGPRQTMPLAPNRASAAVASVDYTLVPGVKISASYTKLSEADGLLGAQGGGALDFGATKTGAATFGASASFGDGWIISETATMAHTTADSMGLLTLAKGGITSTAFEMVAAKTGVFGKQDALRFAFTQPLHIQSGALQYQSLEVVDRSTGELGPVTQTWGISAKREYRMELSYDMPVFDGRALVEGFSLVDTNQPTAAGQALSVSAGARFRMTF